MIDVTPGSKDSVHEFRPFFWLSLLVAVGILSASRSAQAQLPPNFTQETVLSGLTAPVYLETLPDGRMLLLRQSGQILIFDPAQQPAQTSAYLTITNINSVQERGLTSLVLDPDFATNGYFYVYYTHGTSNRNRISRFTHTGNSASLASEVLIWQDNTNWSECCHYGGGLDFGPDGKLYLTTGEEFNGAQAQDMGQAGGKIIRINKDGTIPADNPFVNVPGALDEIWALGLRNPYRAHWDLVNQRFYIGDVGGNIQATAREELNLGVAGGNYAWPNCEGICNNPAWQEPIYDYAHTGETPNGGAITAGFVYRGSQYPAEYAGVFFVSDYVTSEIKYLVLNADGSAVVSVNDFASDVGAPVMLEQGPDGAVYAVDYYLGRVLRFTYNNSSNQVPLIESVNVAPTLGAPPLNVTFSATASDPESQPLTYRWLFGDGTELTGQNVGHTYTSAGSYNVILQVSDGVRSVFSDPIAVEVGTPPVVTINTPADATVFRAGDVINYSGTAVDPDETIPASNYQWDIEFFHNAHVHPVVTGQVGMSGQLTIESSGHDWHDNTGYELTLTVTDSEGLSRSDSIRIYPDKVNLTFATSPAGIPVYIDGIPTAAPFMYDTLIGFEHVVAVPGTYCLNDTKQIFAGWSDGGAVTHQIEVPTASQTYTATFTASGACDALPTSGLVARFEADTGVTVVGGTVTAWADQSGSGNHLVGAGDPAVASYNGVPVIDFDGNGDKLQRIGNLVGLPTGNSSRTVYLVANYRGYGYGGFSWGTETTNETFGLVVAPAPGRLMVQGWGVANDFDSGDAGTGLGLLVQSAVFAGGTLNHYRNGQLIDTRTHTYATTSTRMVLGAEIDSNPYMDMQIGAVLVYDRALTALEQQQVQAYLQAKYFNTLPVANDDSPPAIDEDTTLTVVAANGVLANDTDAESDPLTAVLDTDVANGTLTLSADGSFSYVPDANFNGTDSFTYHANDGGDSNVATVLITINAANDPPMAAPNAYSVAEDAILAIGAPGVLANDTDIDGNPMTAVLETNAAHGSVVLSPNGAFTYTPTANFSGADSFTYRANDGTVNGNVAMVAITVTPVDDPPRQTGVITAPAATESVPYAFDLGAFFTDDEDDPLFYEADVGPYPDGLPLSGNLLVDPDGSLTGVRGRLAGVPANADTSDDGARTVTLTVADRPFSDPTRREITTTFQLTISALDRFDLSMAATVAPNPVSVDETAEWTFTVTNANPLLPADQVELELAFNGTAPFTIADTSGCTVEGQVVSCVVGPVPAGGSLVKTVSTVASDVGDLHVAATVALPAGAPADPDSTNNTAVAAVSIGDSVSAGPAQSLTALPAAAVAVGDLDGDGYDDVVVAGGAGQALAVYFSESKDPADPDAEFRRLATTPVALAQLSLHARAVLLVDLDNDDDLDVVLANGAPGTPEPNSVYLSSQVDGETTLTLVASLGNETSRSVAAADLDANGFADLVFANGSPNEVFLNQGSGVFAAGAALGNGDTRAVAIADFDGDLLPDLAFANADGANEVYRNLGGGAFAAPLVVEPDPALDVAAADVDGDSAPDLVFARSAATAVPSKPVYINESTVGTLGFAKRGQELGAVPTLRLHAADFDEDGVVDLLALNATGTHQLFVGGGLEFTLHAEQFSTEPLTGAALGDLNNDGRPDVAIATTSGVHVFLSDGLGHFGAGDTAPPTIQLVGQATMTLTVGAAFADPGATATDLSDGNVTSGIDVTNPVNTGVAGTYTVEYEVTDRSGNTGKATRTVIVQAVAAPPPSSGGGGGGGGSIDLVILALLLVSLCWRERIETLTRRWRSRSYTARTGVL